jgi:pyruvate/2-oxoglutarate dehydrogenase complex dihydrolipoamide dehydrogenase (E3) component
MSPLAVDNGTERQGSVAKKSPVKTVLAVDVGGRSVKILPRDRAKRASIIFSGPTLTRDRLIPDCVFTDPQLARVGLSEGEEKRQGIEARVAKLPMSAVLRTHTIDERQGFMKELVAARDDRILGFTMIGAEADEVVAAVQMAMLVGLPYTALRDAILAHPTMAEGLGPLFSNVPRRLS